MNNRLKSLYKKSEKYIDLLNLLTKLPTGISFININQYVIFVYTMYILLLLTTCQNYMSTKFTVIQTLTLAERLKRLAERDIYKILLFIKLIKRYLSLLNNGGW